MPTPFPTALRSSRSGITDFIAVLNALYSASIVEVAMSGWSLLVQMTGQLAMQMAKPVRLFTHDGSCLSSYGQRPAKSASTKQSMTNSLCVGFNTSPSSCVCFKILPYSLQCNFMTAFWTVSKSGALTHCVSDIWS